MEITQRSLWHLLILWCAYKEKTHHQAFPTPHQQPSAGLDNRGDLKLAKLRKPKASLHILIVWQAVYNNLRIQRVLNKIQIKKNNNKKKGKVRKGRRNDCANKHSSQEQTEPWKGFLMGQWGQQHTSLSGTLGFSSYCCFIGITLSSLSQVWTLLTLSHIKLNSFLFII